LTKLEKYCTSIAVECLSPWIAMGRQDDIVQHGENLITIAVIDAEENDNNKSFIYVKGREKCQWLIDILDSDNLTIEILDADYKDIDSLRNLNITNTVQCGNH